MAIDLYFVLSANADGTVACPTGDQAGVCALSLEANMFCGAAVSVTAARRPGGGGWGGGGGCIGVCCKIWKWNKRVVIKKN